MLGVFLVGCLLAAILLGLRIYNVLPPRFPPKRLPGDKCSLGIFLGSGGHTSEMKALLQTIDFERYNPRVYVYCPPDEISLRTISEVEVSKKTLPNAYSIISLPRARKVGESKLSTLFSASKTLLVALLHTFLLPLIRNPSKPWVDVLLVNGPGTCVVLVAITYIRRILGLRYSRVIYVESFARVNSLSLSGRILKPFVDTFVVQWPEAAGTGTVHSDKKDHEEKSIKERVTYRGWLV